MTKPQLQQELQARGEPIDGVKWPLNTISVLATRVELLLELGFGHGGWGFQSCSHTTLLKRNGSPGSRPGSPEFAAVRDRTAAIAPYAGALPRVMAKVTADPQSSVSEYLDLASLQNNLTEGP